ncbi:MAG: aminopeptidase N [Pigmentiphaga sp.]
MRTDTPVTIRRHDYLPYPFHIDRVALEFDLDPATTRVLARYEVRRRDAADTSALRLNGEALELLEVRVGGQPWPTENQQFEAGFLILHGLPARAVVEIISHCHPAENTTLMGLYVSHDVFFTQCEAEGFRRIAWFPDRPDVMSIYTVTLRADAARYPVLLSNGNLLEETQLPDGRLQARWHDPFPKPSYLFALVAGKLGVREKTVATRSGRSVLLQVYCDPGNENKTEWALASLERSLRWDEQRFNLELDLDRFMIVAVRDFNMGAMENKGLNIFNAAYVLADPDTATDANYRAIEAVIGHEYFHNWTGNRVTCRDWFQLSLKEGLTVFRDQEFTADMMAAALAEAGELNGQALEHAQASARAVKRIDDVQALRAAQFPEDAGPMAHPIRPESYQEIGNFYTATVYEKGAEVIRMQHTLLGEAGFQAGMAEYFRRHDGQAVTCDNFVAAMESVYVRQDSGRDLKRFREWYRQAGTPRVSVTLHYDAPSRRCTVTLSQRNPPVGVERLAGDAALKPALHIPFAIGLISPNGKPVPLRLVGSAEPPVDTLLLELTSEEAQWTFADIDQPPVPSLLRDFSAPVRVAYDYTDRELALLLAHDGNAFARWEAGQELATRHLLALATAFAQREAPPSSGAVIEAWRAVLADGAVDPAWRARALALPGERLLAERQSPIQPQALSQAREFLRALLGRELAGTWREVFLREAVDGPYSPQPLAVGRRDLRHLALSYWLAGDEDDEARQAAAELYQHAGNMTERVAALGALLSHARNDPATAAALAHFYKRWHDDPLVIDKWFALQATALGTNVADVRSLMAHPAFTLRNPNRARALVFQFCLNQPRGFHQADGQGYAFWQEQVLALDAINPEIAARLARALEQFRRYDAPWCQAMEDALTSVRKHPGLSRNVTEIVAKALEISA